MKPSAKELMATQGTLAAIAAEAAELSQLLLESGGELSPELESRLEFNSQQLLAKVDGYNYIIEEFETQAAVWKRRKDACGAIQKRFETRVESLKDRIKAAMKEMGKTEIGGNFYKFQLRKSAPKLIIADETAVPNDFKMVVQSTVVDKEKLKAALVDGFKVPGAEIQENGSLYALENAGKEK